jgi:hypothetical protein
VEGVVVMLVDNCEVDLAAADGTAELVGQPEVDIAAAEDENAGRCGGVHADGWLWLTGNLGLVRR